MTISDIFNQLLNTPIDKIWSYISPFIAGYFIMYVLFYIFVFSFITYVGINMIKRRRKFNKDWKNKKRW